MGPFYLLLKVLIALFANCSFFLASFICKDACQNRVSNFLMVGNRERLHASFWLFSLHCLALYS